MYYAKAIRGLDVGKRTLCVESNELHDYEGVYEAIGGYISAFLPDKRYDSILQVAEVFSATAEPVPDVIN